LAERIRNASRRTKAALPWLKLAKFGTKRSDKNSLRHDGNLDAITGCEIDYDGEQISFDDALKVLGEMHISALTYTSPSHTPDAPRYRILAPTSKPLPPAMRAALVARINGFMKAKLGVEKFAATESFAISQAYYFGWVTTNTNRDHRVEVTEGEFIDLRSDLAEYEAVGKKAGSASDDKPQADPDRVHGFDAIIAIIGDGDGLNGFNDPLSRAAASYVALHNGSPFDKAMLKSLLRDAINSAPKKPTRNPGDITRYLSDAYLDDIIATAERKFVQRGPITLDDFVAVMSKGSYLFKPTREAWPTKSVNVCLPQVPLTKKDGTPVVDKKTKKPLLIAASTWLDMHQRVEQITWAPGFAEIIKDRLVDEGGWIERVGVSIFNLYRPPTLVTTGLHVTEAEIAPWIDHLKAIYPDDGEHIIKFLAHRCQLPFDKINHNLLLGGLQGIGKDTLLEPVRYAVGPWNFKDINPADMLGPFNPFLRAVVLRINEARDLGEVNRFAFYEHLKTICAAPPMVLRVNEKNLREHYIHNCCGVITTTNHKTGGIYLPPDDRRTYVAWSNCLKEAFADDYWKKLWGWYSDQDGIRKVAAFLRTYDLSSFNAKAPPARTPAFLEIVASGIATEEIELSDLIERMGSPDALTLTQLCERAGREGDDLEELSNWLNDRTNRKAVPHKLEQVGYVRVPNPDNKQGIWTIKTWQSRRNDGGQCDFVQVQQRQPVYGKASLSYADQTKAVRTMIQLIEQREDGEKQAKEEARQRWFQSNPKVF
jgi:hypothetical protein